MTNKEAVERLNELLLCTSLLSDNDHESMRAGIKALEVVEEIKKSFVIKSNEPDLSFVINSSRHSVDEIYHILCKAYGTSWNSET